MVVSIVMSGTQKSERDGGGLHVCVCLKGFDLSPHLTERSPSATDTPSIIQEVSMKYKCLLPEVRCGAALVPLSLSAYCTLTQRLGLAIDSLQR